MGFHYLHGAFEHSQQFFGVGNGCACSDSLPLLFYNSAPLGNIARRTGNHFVKAPHELEGIKRVPEKILKFRKETSQCAHRAAVRLARSVLLRSRAGISSAASAPLPYVGGGGA